MCDKLVSLHDLEQLNRRCLALFPVLELSITADDGSAGHGSWVKWVNKCE